MHVIQRSTCQRRTRSPSAFTRQPRLPIIVPRAGSASNTPNGDTRFWRVMSSAPPQTVSFTEAVKDRAARHEQQEHDADDQAGHGERGCDGGTDEIVEACDRKA